jgi:hypothetical protein
MKDLNFERYLGGRKVKYTPEKVRERLRYPALAQTPKCSFD